MLRRKPEITREFNKTRDGHGFAVDDVTAMNAINSVAATLPAQLEETGKSSIARGKRLL
jgi:hypothetical protein